MGEKRLPQCDTGCDNAKAGDVEADVKVREDAKMRNIYTQKLIDAVRPNRRRRYHANRIREGIF